jgi:hypothetical protein
MQSIPRAARFLCLSWAVLMLAACAGQKEPAQKLLLDIDATVIAASAEAAKYVPDQLIDVQTRLAALKASFDRQDYPAVTAGAPAALASAQTLATAAAAKKDAVLKVLNDDWTNLATTVPGDITALQARLELLAKKSSKKLAAGVDLEAAGTSLTNLSSLWSKAQAAFATGNLDEAVTTAGAVKKIIDALAATLRLELKAPIDPR